MFSQAGETFMHSHLAEDARHADTSGRMTTSGAAAEPTEAAGSRLPLVSVVTATRNRPDSLERLLASLCREGYPRLEILLYDDASDPPLRGAGPGIPLLRGEEQRGACFRRNRCFELARGEFVAMLDDDTELVAPGLFASSVELMRRHPDTGMLMYREMRSDDPVGPPGEALEIARPGFYGCFIRAEALRRVGPYLVDVFGYYWEEVEFAIRLLDAGVPDRVRAVARRPPPRRRAGPRLAPHPPDDGIQLHDERPAPVSLRDVPRGLAGPVRMFCKRPPIDGRRDWLGLAWVAADLVAKVPYVLRNRAPVRHATVMRYRQLARRPLPVDLAGGRAARAE
jgi:glycosyltransferase involved in cell wall biosynthesis